MTSMRFAHRMSDLGTETAFEVLARAKGLEAQGRDIVHLEIGEPDFNTHEEIVEAAVEALRGGHHHYTPSAGILPLRQAIAREISETRQISVDADEVVVTPGAKPIIFFCPAGSGSEGGRGDLSRSGIPHLRVDDPVCGSAAGARSVAGGVGFPDRYPGTRRFVHAHAPVSSFSTLPTIPPVRC